MFNYKTHIVEALDKAPCDFGVVFDKKYANDRLSPMLPNGYRPELNTNCSFPPMLGPVFKFVAQKGYIQLPDSLATATRQLPPP